MVIEFYDIYSFGEASKKSQSNSLLLQFKKTNKTKHTFGLNKIHDI